MKVSLVIIIVYISKIYEMFSKSISSYNIRKYEFRQMYSGQAQSSLICESYLEFIIFCNFAILKLKFAILKFSKMQRGNLSQIALPNV